eukprot:5583303-Alexandrium_andersonii.AAC.1
MALKLASAFGNHAQRAITVPMIKSTTCLIPGTCSARRNKCPRVLGSFLGSLLKNSGAMSSAFAMPNSTP